MIKIINSASLTPEEIIDRKEELKTNIEGIVSDIIYNVRKNGDTALKEYSKKFDNVELSSLLVTKEEIEHAYNSVDKEFIEVLTLAKENIYTYHEKQKRDGFEIKKENGVVLGQKITPIERAGVYVPGGTASYPSTVLMNVIPAKIAGVKNITMVTPPKKDGKINPVILAAAKIAGVDNIYKVGGAQAIAALAYGTESIKKVDKIVGPGNAFVAEAKKQVFGTVNIDMIAGPSEILIISDEKSEAKNVAADLLSQAEHDKMATAILITTSPDFAKEVSDELEKQIPLLEREEIARASIDNNGKIIITDTIEKAIEISNEIAPEHLEVCVDEPFLYLELIKNAGSIFLGRYCPEALGDYLAGPNHTLPTSGTAKFSSPLGVDDFIKKSAYSFYTKEALKDVADKIKYFADKEGLQAHGKSAVIRFE